MTATLDAPGFFEPDHTYTRYDGSTFQCVAITTHPEGGRRLALGWLTDTADWTFLAQQNLGQWLHEYNDGKPTQTATAADPAPDYKAAVADALRLLETAPEAFQAAPSQNITAAAHVLRQAHEAGGGK
jgi:hypothetical protein